MLRCLSTLLLPVAWTTATAYKFRPSTYVLFGLCSTLQHVWWSKKRKCDSITPTLRKYLHWLLVHQRVDFKTCLLVYKCLHQLASSSSRHCSLQWRQSQPVGICGPLISVSWPHQERELWVSVHKVSRLLAYQCGTVCRRNSRARH